MRRRTIGNRWGKRYLFVLIAAMGTSSASAGFAETIDRPRPATSDARLPGSPDGVAGGMIAAVGVGDEGPISRRGYRQLVGARGDSDGAAGFALGDLHWEWRHPTNPSSPLEGDGTRAASAGSSSGESWPTWLLLWEAGDLKELGGLGGQLSKHEHSNPVPVPLPPAVGLGLLCLAGLYLMRRSR